MRFKKKYANSRLNGRLKLTFKRFCMGLIVLSANKNFFNHLAMIDLERPEQTLSGFVLPGATLNGLERP